jgi:signal transduction histidine kinase
MSAGEEVPPLEFRMNLADNSIRRYQISGQLVQYSNGPHVVGVSKDVTEERQREAERRETEKLAALGHLAGGVAHEINNLLLPVISLSELVQEDLAGMPDRVLADEMSENLTMVMNCGRQARDIVRKILRYSRHEIPNLSLTDLVATVNSAVELVRELLSPGVKLTVEFALEVAGMARMDGSEMTQVVMNLAVNADHAMNGQGDLRLRLEKVRLSKSVARSKLVEPGEYFLLRVADTGAGMDAATQARIFDPFFTTKPVGQGTGLGLSMVQGIMKSWNGTIAVSSEIGKGTEFRLYIPVITGASQQADAGSPVA